MKRKIIVTDNLLEKKKYGDFTFTVKEIDGARITKLLVVHELPAPATPEDN